MTNPDPFKTTGHHDTSQKVDHKKSKAWLWPLLAVAALAAALLFLFAGDNDIDNRPDSIDQFGNDKPGNCQTTAKETGVDQGTGDFAPDDQNDC